MRPADTSPEAWQFQLELQRRTTPAERLQRALELSDLVRSFARAGIREAHPEASEREVFLMLAERSLGPELFHKVYGEATDDRLSRRT
jgi:hypothetical protein